MFKKVLYEKVLSWNNHNYVYISRLKLIFENLYLPRIDE